MSLSESVIDRAVSREPNTSKNLEFLRLRTNRDDLEKNLEGNEGVLK